MSVERSCPTCGAPTAFADERGGEGACDRCGGWFRVAEGGAPAQPMGRAQSQPAIVVRPDRRELIDRWLRAVRPR